MVMPVGALRPPTGPEPAKIRPAVVMQEDWLLATDMATVLVIPLTSNSASEAFPGKMLLPPEASGLGSPKLEDHHVATRAACKLTASTSA
jgi:mRNA-degrading endonuclease toxin of MazEF toxin-antitoxin module